MGKSCGLPSISASAPRGTRVEGRDTWEERVPWKKGTRLTALEDIGDYQTEECGAKKGKRSTLRMKLGTLRFRILMRWRRPGRYVVVLPMERVGEATSRESQRERRKDHEEQ